MFSSPLLNRLRRTVFPHRGHARSATMLCLGAALMSVGSAQATELFTTQQDFTGWSGGTALTAATAATPDSDGATTNGLGNTTAAGSAGTAGALQVTVNSGTYDTVGSNGEAGNSAFLAALAGASPLTSDFTYPANAGNYFQLILLLNYNGNYDQIGPTSVSVTPNANGFYTATYKLPAGLPSAPSSGLTYFQLGFIMNSNTPAGQTFTIDNVAVPSAPVPEPASLGIFALAGAGIAMLGRRSKSAGND